MITVGTISHGTLRPQDLLRSFADAYKQYCNDDEEYRDSYIEEAHHLADLLDNDKEYPVESGETISEHASRCIDDLMDELNRIAAKQNPELYFGNTEGDGSDFGFWPIEGDR